MRSLFNMLGDFIRREWFLLITVAVIALIIGLFEFF
jgi:hypothetical protein